MNYICCTESTRRNDVKRHQTLNGIDFLEVLDIETDPYNERQTTLYLHFLKNLSLGDIHVANVQIFGGERIKNIKVLEVMLDLDTPFPLSPPEEASKVLVVRVSEAGDFSTYTLRLVSDALHTDEVPHGFDPVLSSVDFSFKVNCPSEFDCKPVHLCPPEQTLPLEINYLAKDYASFRQLMLDRMALVMPDWRERNPADVGIVLVEMLAYVADHLSYRQDALATEAYLGTARKRISVRRHARLVDYFMHDGCNARTWLQVVVGKGVKDITLKPKDENGHITRILSKMADVPPVFGLDSPLYDKAVSNAGKVFELTHDLTLYEAHNEMTFYLWDKSNCCLPKGATAATLDGDFSASLKEGDVLILAEVLGAETGQPQDADPTRRHAVKLTKVKKVYDTLMDGSLALPLSPPSSPPMPLGLPVTEIEWDSKDALPFPLCMSNQNITNISVAWGNIVLVDHGFTVGEHITPASPPEGYVPKEEVIGTVPEAVLTYAKNGDNNHDFCEKQTKENIPIRFRPKLLRGPLSNGELYTDSDKSKPASTLLTQSKRVALPFITLQQTDATNTSLGTWNPKRDLLNSPATKKEFVVEMEGDGTSYLRFGDGRQGERPKAGTRFKATYRVGNGKNGNVGADTLVHFVIQKLTEFNNTTHKEEEIPATGKIIRVWNPLPAQGGTEAETMEEVHQFAPQAFRTQKRAVTANDYEFFAQQSPLDVQRVAATFRWTGSWKTVFLTADRLEGLDITAKFEKDLRNNLEQYRMAGFDLEVDAPLFVSLEIELTVCVNPHFFASNVKQALLETFSNRILSDGRKGMFHPDNFTFGQPVYLSHLYAAAQATEGVDSVRIIKFCRQGDTDNTAIDSGKLILGRREIARCDNDRNFPERGVFNIYPNGGR